ncbi:cellulose biosynthesis cyclic di-GMP-binding regulatory protein BcsB [Acidithiobacillus sp.]
MTSKNYRNALLFIGLCWGLVSAPTAMAQPPAPALVTLPLAALAQGKKVTVLQQGHPDSDLSWTIEPHYAAQQAKLQVRYLTSPATPPGSQLLVAMDGQIVGAVTLNPELPRGSFTVLLGHQAFAAGVHHLVLRLIPGPVAGGGPAAATSAWTQIDFTASQLSYAQQVIPWRHLDFSHLPGMLQESAQQGSLPLPMQFYGVANTTLLRAGQEAVAGVALRSPAAVKVDAHATASLAGAAPQQAANGLRVSAALGVASAIPPSLLPQTPITGPTILLEHDPDNALGVTILFTGKTDAEILQAAQAFAVNRTVLPLGDRWNVVNEGDDLSDASFGPKDAVYPGEPITLHDLQGPAAASTVPHSTATISFWMPGGLFASRQSNLKMALTMATQSLQTSSDKPIITVLANHHWISEWKLTPGVANYQTTIPFTALVAGDNRVTFHIVGGKVSVFPNSTIQLPAAHRYAVLPDLSLFQRTGFPLVANGTGKHLSVWYANGPLSDWSAGLTLFGRLAQASHSPLPDARATFSMPTTRNVLAVGTAASIPAQWLSASPLVPKNMGIQWRVSTRHGTSPWLGATNHLAPAYLIESPTPYPGEVAVTFLASSEAGLKTAAWHLVEMPNWNGLHGDLAWETGSGTFPSTLVGSHFLYGSRNSGWFWIFLFSVKPWLWVLAGVAAVLFAALVVWTYTLRKKAQWRAEEAV